MPEPSSLHIDQLLSDMSVKYRNGDMIWPEVLPIRKVGKRSDKFTKYNKEDSYRVYDDKIGPKSMPNEVDWGTSADNYSVKDHALGDWLPQESIDNADNPVQPEVDTNEFLNLNLDLAQEQRVGNIVFAAGSYPAGNKVQLAGDFRWGGSTDDPIGDILTGIEACFERPNVLVMGSDVWKVFRKLPEVLDAVRAVIGGVARGGLVTAPEVAALFELEKVLIGRARYISTKEGQAATYTRLWGKHAALLKVVPNPGVKTICFGVTFAEMLRQTQRDFDPKRGIKGAHYFKVAWNSDEKVIASDAAYFIQDAVA